MSEEKKKSLFDRAIDALTDRDEKEAAAAAQQKALADAARKEAEARARVAAEKAEADRAALEKATSAKAASERVTAMREASEKASAERAAAPRKGVVTVRSLRIRADHSTSSAVVGGLVKGDEVTILTTWSDGKDTWAQLSNGWSAMVYNGETYIQAV
ncbi:MAG: SH3 domain-containing protein [Chloroflexota bacterium]|nr:SH3 domain-containing protein [Chloroflexota bacterium]